MRCAIRVLKMICILFQDLRITIRCALFQDSSTYNEMHFVPGFEYLK